MLNLTKNNQISPSNIEFEEKKRIKSSKHFPYSTREWKNSIYLYNKNNLNLIPSTDLFTINIIKSYFSLFNKKIEDKSRTKRFTLKYRKYSAHKIYVSNGEFKHTNNKVIINLYLFNRQKNNYNIAIKWLKIQYKKGLKRNFKFFSQRFNLLEKQSLILLNKKKLFLIKNIKKNNFNKRIGSYINIYIENYLFKLLNKEYNKTLLYWYYKRVVFINKSKYTYIYLQYLKEQIYKIYNKQIEFNLINLKRFFFNSDILSELITKRISKKRKKILGYLKKLKDKVKIHRKNTYLHKYIINKKLNNKKNLSGFFNKSSNSLIKIVISKLKYKDITGFRLEARGRLTKRYTASRSILKVAYKGNLFNIDSSLKGLSSVLLKGNLKSNMQYTKLASKSRIGSFGIKGWISSD